jgi:hypothetical protein
MELRAKDYGYDITFNIKDKETGAAKDITGNQGVTLLVADSETHRNIFEGACSVLDAPNGKVKYTVAPENFVKAGNYVGALKVKYSDTKIITTGDVAITVLPFIGKF